MRNSSRTFKSAYLLMGVASLALIGLPQIAAAQEADSGDLIVTAQKREQKLKNVPIVVTTISGKLLQATGVRDIKDMTILTPGLTVTSTTNEASTTARIRGVGTVGDNPGLESSVGVVIDGVYRPRNGVGFGDLGEMERIEVLKGPQGTLFGKNTSAGVINIITKAPSFNFGAEGELTAGNYGAKGISASVTGALVPDQIAGRLYVAKRERDGFYKVNTGTGPRTNKEDQNQNFYTIRGQLLMTPNSDLKIRIIGDYSKREESCCVAVQIKTGPTGAIVNGVSGGNGVMATPNPQARTAYSNRSTNQKIFDKGVSTEAELNIDNVGTLTSVTALREWRTSNAQDIDFSGADILYRNGQGEFDSKFQTFTQEFRLAGGDDKVNWLIGAFMSNERLTRHDAYNYGAAYESYLSLILSSGTNPGTVAALTGRPVGTSYAAGSAAARDLYRQTSNSFALFTNNTFKLSPDFEITAGLRYTMDNKKINASYTSPNGGVGCAAALPRYVASLTSSGAPTAWFTLTAAQKQSAIGLLCLPWSNPAYNARNTNEKDNDKQLSGTLKAAYRWNEDFMTYVSFAKGYKAGGYNLDRAQSVTSAGIVPNASLFFPGETAYSYEIGAKSSWFANKLMFNVTAYSQRFEKFQLNTFLGTAFIVESIPLVNANGVDMDLYWTTPIKGLSVQGGATFSKTTYGAFTASEVKAGSFPGLSLLPNNNVSFAPRTTASVSLNWSGMLGNLRGSWNLAAKYNDKFNTGSDLIPMKEQAAYTLVNSRIGVGSANQKWTFELWGQNLTNEVYSQVVFNAPLQGSGFQSTVQTTGSHPGTYYNQALDSNTYNAFLGQPRTYGATLRVRY